MTERLWAGWRMTYLRQGAGESTGEACLFCGLGKLSPAVENLVLEVYEHSFLVLNAFPYTSGHVMVALRRHDDSLLGTGKEERAEVQAALERARRAVSNEYQPHGFNMGLNLGRAAGAGVLGHLHWHVVPRWDGDTNFMPAVADLRVLPEALADTYHRLLHSLSGLPAEGLRITARGRGASA